MARFTDYRTFKTAVGGRLLQLEIGNVAEQANGQCMVRYGDSVVNVTACASKEARADIDFLPLSCEYEEKMYAFGKIPGGFIKREGRPSEKATLSSRLMDRPLRPLFPKTYHNDIVIVATVMSVDPDCSPEIAGMCAASIAVHISDIPWAGPIAGISVGLVDDEIVLNPTAEQRKNNIGAVEAVHIDFASDGTPCKNVVVTGCTFDDLPAGIGTHHINPARGDNIRIYGNTFKNIWFSCVHGSSFRDMTLTADSETASITTTMIMICTPSFLNACFIAVTSVYPILANMIHMMHMKRGSFRAELPLYVQY